MTDKEVEKLAWEIVEAFVEPSLDERLERLQEQIQKETKFFQEQMNKSLYTGRLRLIGPTQERRSREREWYWDRGDQSYVSKESETPEYTEEEAIMSEAFTGEPLPHPWTLRDYSYDCEEGKVAATWIRPIGRTGTETWQYDGTRGAVVPVQRCEVLNVIMSDCLWDYSAFETVEHRDLMNMLASADNVHSLTKTTEPI
jgi:hypothetical protein